MYQPYKGFDFVGENLHHLKALVASNTFIDHDNITVITQNNTKLEKLYLSNCNKLTIEAFGCIGEKLSKLKEFDIRGCNYITNDNINLITRNNKHMRYLNIYQYTLLTDLSFLYINNNLDKLKFLNGKFCERKNGDYSMINKVYFDVTTDIEADLSYLEYYR